MRYDGARLADFSVKEEKQGRGRMDLSFLLLVLNALVMWSCCAINRGNSLSCSATAPCIADTREPDEKDRISNGCECQNTER